MKRFKTKKNNNIFLIIILTICFLVFFVLISLNRLSSKNTNLIGVLLNHFSNVEKNFLSFNLDYLFKTSEFLSKEEVVYNEFYPVIYLYNTHDTETYQDKYTVYDANKLLFTNLKKMGITSLVEDRKTISYKNMGLSYYDISRSFLLDMKDKYPSIKYFIDIHRDSVTNKSIAFNKKKYAKILFVLGLDNPDYQENKKVLEKMNTYLNINYPGISKGILEKAGSGVNGKYNQDIDKNVLLIEIGGIDNNLEEVNNSTEIIALMLYNMLGDKGEEIS